MVKVTVELHLQISRRLNQCQEAVMELRQKPPNIPGMKPISMLDIPTVLNHTMYMYTMMIVVQ